MRQAAVHFCIILAVLAAPAVGQAQTSTQAPPTVRKLPGSSLTPSFTPPLGPTRPPVGLPPVPGLPSGQSITPPRIACIGGRLQSGSCVCPKGWRRIVASRTAVTCLAIAKPDPVRPKVIADPPASTPGRTVKPKAPASVAGPPRLPARPPAAPPPPPAAPALAADATELPDEVLAAFATTAPDTVEADLAQRFNLTILDRATVALLGQRIVRFRIPDGRAVAAVVAALAADPAASAPQPNHVYRQQQAASPAADAQYALVKVSVADAHRLATGRGATVAVIDTAADLSHPDLAGAVIESHDAVGGSGAAGVHGTAIAGIIAARGVTRGIAPAARILSVRAFEGGSGRSKPHAVTFVVLKALDWSVARGARVANLSFAGPPDGLLGRALAAASARGVIVVAAAGNGGSAAPPAYPAAYPGVIAVTATDARDRLYAHANTGDYIAVSAPGVEVLAASVDRGHDLVTGTSFAAAYVSGMAALLVERAPQLTPDAARRILEAAARDLGKPGKDAEFGAGLVDAAVALARSVER